MSKELEKALEEAGVFKGADGLRRLCDAHQFWEEQPYGTRLYFGGGVTDYLHRDVLRAVINVADTFLASQQGEQHPEQAEGAQDEREAFILRMIEERDISRTMAGHMWDSRQPSPAPELEQLRYKAELYDEVWALATGMGYMNVTTALDMLKREHDALAAQLAELKGQEPVGELVLFGGTCKEVAWKNGRMPKAGAKLYTKPVTPAQQAVPEGWSGWATQYPGKMPTFFGAREIAEKNWYPEEGADLIRVVEVERIAAVPQPVAQKGENYE